MKPLPASVASVNVAEEFNAAIEVDLMFYLDHIILHCICRCTRWHAAIEVKGRDTDTLIEGLHDCWIRIHGPPKELLVDGEGGIAEAYKTAAFLEAVIVSMISSSLLNPFEVLCLPKRLYRH